MSLMIDTLNSTPTAEESSNSDKLKVQKSIGESTSKILKPNGLTEISIFDYAELRNYIYGVNGRY